MTFNRCMAGLAICLAMSNSWAAESENTWAIETTEQWKQASAKSENLSFKDGVAEPTAETATYSSVVHRFKAKRKPDKLTIGQSHQWLNWNPVPNIGPKAGDAPILLRVAKGDYWFFGLRGGVYHAFRSRDMKTWKHYGPVLAETNQGKHKAMGRWCISAEYADGKAYIYYDHPNDQDPHLIIDEDLTDGKPGKNMGLAFADPSDGSDAGIIRSLDGKFHIIYEDWSPISANKHSWDSPLAGHAVSDDGIKDFKILKPAVDEPTKPTGTFKTYNHPHWRKEHPGFKSNKAKYEVHKPEQDAYGDWAAIAIGGQYYLFGDFHPKGKKGKKAMSVAWFTAPGINERFRFCGNIGRGHPDPDIIFAEGQFYLVTQMKTDYISPGPWVESVEARAGVDTTNDGKIDTWTDWTAVKEAYEGIKGFAKQVKRHPASLDLTGLPAGFGVSFELRIKDTTKNESKPILERVEFTFDGK